MEYKWNCFIVLSGSIEVTIATMTKAERSRTDEVYIVGFVPCHLPPKKRPCSFDPFLHPLLTEIEDSFISGMLRNNLTYMHCWFGQPQEIIRPKTHSYMEETEHVFS